MNILVTSNHGSTFNPKEGADVRKYNIVLELAKHNEVTVLESNRYACDRIKVPVNININYFNEYYIFSKPLSSFTDFNLSFISKILGIIRTKNIHLIQISFPNGIVVTKLMTILMNSKIPIIYDAHNVEGDTVKQISESSLPSLLRYFFLIYIPLLERIVVKCVNHIIVVSNDDKSRFVEKYGVSEKKITVIPSGLKISDPKNINNRNEIRKRFGINKNEIGILFHGTYSYYPNKEAINVIVDYIAPRIGKKFTNVFFLLAGNGLPIFERLNINSIGFVEDLDSLLSIADIAIVPILHGGGARLKILDYMAFGLPIVTTKKGIEGIEAENGKEAIIVEEVNNEFIEAIEHLINNEEERQKIGENARILLEEKYDREKIGERLNNLYLNLLRQTNA